MITRDQLSYLYKFSLHVTYEIKENCKENIHDDVVNERVNITVSCFEYKTSEVLYTFLLFLFIGSSPNMVT